jgi:hypothetical protein
MKPQIAWRREREYVDRLLARMASDTEFRHRVTRDPLSVIGDLSGVPVERRAAKCGPLKTSCPPGKTCGKGKSCVKTLISVM